MKTMTMPTGAAATSATGHMPMATGMSMGMESMEMIFFTSTTTPLWTSSFSPKSTGQYAGVCIFLIAFSVMFRVLLAFRINFYDIMAATRRRRRPGLLAHDTDDIKAPKVRRWKADEAVMVGAVDVAVAGVSYLL